MKRIFAILAVTAATGISLGGAEIACTQKQVDDATKVAVNILCAIEHAELDDPELEKLCGALTAQERAALAAHRRKLVEAKTIVVQAKCDGGVR